METPVTLPKAEPSVLVLPRRKLVSYWVRPEVPPTVPRLRLMVWAERPEAALQALGLDVTSITFQGGHRLDDATLHQLAGGHHLS